MGIFVAYRKYNGRVTRWVIDTKEKVLRPRLDPDEEILEISPEEYKRVAPDLQPWVTQITGLDPGEDDSFVEVSAGKVIRKVYKDPKSPLGPREQKYKDLKKSRVPKEPPLPPRDTPYTM